MSRKYDANHQRLAKLVFAVIKTCRLIERTGGRLQEYTDEQIALLAKEGLDIVEDPTYNEGKRILRDYKAGNLTYSVAYNQLMDLGCPDHIATKALDKTVQVAQ